MFTCVFRRPKARLRVLPALLLAVTALSLLIGLPTSSAQAADFYIIGGSGGGGGVNVDIHTGGVGGAAVGKAGAGGNTSPNGTYGAGGGGAFVGEDLEAPASPGSHGTDLAFGTGGRGVGVGARDGEDGANHRGGNGGAGGSALFIEDNNRYDSLFILGGNGGSGAEWDISTGGVGGSAHHYVLYDLTVTGGISLTSGLAGILPNSPNGAGGAVRLNAGTLIAPTIKLTKNNGNLDFTVTDALVWTGSGDFTVTQNVGTARITIGSLTIDGGTVNKDNYANLISAGSYYTTKDITLGSGGATFDTSGGDQGVGRNLIGTGGLTKTGTGTLTLTGANAHTGGTTINSGTLKGNIADNTDLTIATGATYDGNNAARTVSALNGGGNILHTNGLTVQSGDFGGVIDATNSGGLTKTGAGTLTLTGANAYTGPTRIDGGNLALSGNGSLGASSLLDLRGGHLDISGITPASLSLPNLDVHGPANLNIGTKTADFSGKTLSFYVPSGMGAGGTLLSVGGTGTANIGNSVVRVGIEGASSPLGAGHAITLIDVPDGTLDGDPANTTSSGEGMQGVTLRYAFDVAKNGNQLTATVAGNPKTDPSAKALSEGRLSGMATALMGADLAAGTGLDNARRAAGRGQDNGGPYGLAAFGAFSGGISRYNTGSHVDVSGVSALVGLAKRFDAAPGSFLTGAFFEYGYGRSSTHIGFDDRPSVDGSGQSSYYGGGLLARFDLTTSPLAGLYAEGSFRFGRLSTDWHSDDLRDAFGRRADYDSSVPYYGAHAGLGYIWNLSEESRLDVYGKYFWTRLEGDSPRLSTGDPVDFKATDSQRLRAGARFTKALNERVAPYIGAAWEHEFDGKARATAYGLDVPAPSLKGDSGVFELGVSFKPEADSAFSLDLAAQGYVGMRQGVSGSLQLKWEF